MKNFEFRMKNSQFEILHSKFFILPTITSRMSSAGRAPLLSVIVPCYNERATVAELLRRVKEVPIEKEIIVVDDASTDGSRDVVASLAQQWPEIRHILQPVNQ